MINKSILQFLRNEEGATAIEYALIAGLIAVGLAASLTSLGSELGAFFTRITTKLSTLVV